MGIEASAFTRFYNFALLCFAFALWYTAGIGLFSKLSLLCIIISNLFPLLNHGIMTA